jgi:sugar O-acyltransferase (sialic acid O-acetyltransferase NeuD family)
MTESIIMCGASGHARMIADLLNVSGQFELVGVLDNASDSPPSEFCSVAVSTNLDQLDAWKSDGIIYAIAAVGDNSARSRLSQSLRDRGFELPSLIHPSAVVSPTSIIGSGVVIGANAVVGPGCRIEDFALINSGGIVEHDCLLETAAAIGPGATVGGGCSLGIESWVGIGAVVNHGVTIGAKTIVGAGAVVVRDLPDQVVAYGVPAKPMRDVVDGERIV